MNFSQFRIIVAAARRPLDYETLAHAGQPAARDLEIASNEFACSSARSRIIISRLVSSMSISSNFSFAQCSGGLCNTRRSSI